MDDVEVWFTDPVTSVPTETVNWAGMKSRFDR
jgi:hypothetical protein